MKKLFISILIILLMISIYKDLTLGTKLSNDREDEQQQPSNSVVTHEFEAVKIKIVHGDTLITVIERLNPDLGSINMEQIKKDFQSLNPTVNPNQLQINRYYFFPQYEI